MPSDKDMYFWFIVIVLVIVVGFVAGINHENNVRINKERTEIISDEIYEELTYVSFSKDKHLVSDDEVYINYQTKTDPSVHHTNVQYYSIGLGDENKIGYKIVTKKDDNGDEQYVRTKSREFFVTKETYDELMHIK